LIGGAGQPTKLHIRCALAEMKGKRYLDLNFRGANSIILQPGVGILAESFNRI